MFKWTYRFFGHNYWVAALSTLYLTVLGIIIPSLKSIGQFWHAYINKSKKPKIVMFTYWLFGNNYRVASLSKM